MTDAKAPKELFDFRVHELSLVKKGANRRPRYLLKSEDSELSKLGLIEKLNTLSPAQAKAIDEKTKAVLKNYTVSEEGENALKASMALLEIAKAEIPEGLLLGIGETDIVVTLEKSEEIKKLGSQKYPAGKEYPSKTGNAEEESDDETGEDAEDETNELGGTFEKKNKSEGAGSKDSTDQADSSTGTPAKKDEESGEMAEDDEEAEKGQKKPVKKTLATKPVGEADSGSQTDPENQMPADEQGTNIDSNKKVKKEGGKNDMEDLTEENAADISRTVKAEVDAAVEKALADINVLHIDEIEQIKKSYEQRVQKAMDFIDEKNKENVSRIMKGEFPIFEEISKEAQTMIQKQAEEIEVLKQDLIKRQDREAELVAINKAEKEFSSLGAAQEVGRLIKKAHQQLDTVTYEAFEGILKFAQGQIETLGDITKEIGSKGMGSDYPDTEDKVQKMAEDLKVEHPDWSIEKARIEVRKKYPNLYK